MDERLLQCKEVNASIVLAVLNAGGVTSYHYVLAVYRRSEFSLYLNTRAGNRRAGSKRRAAHLRSDPRSNDKEGDSIASVPRHEGIPAESIPGEYQGKKDGWRMQGAPHQEIDESLPRAISKRFRIAACSFAQSPHCRQHE